VVRNLAKEEEEAQCPEIPDPVKYWVHAQVIPSESDKGRV
jgi:hypothetical protein